MNARQLAGRAGWLWNRLRCMPPAEPWYRLQQALVTALVRRGVYARPAPAAALPVFAAQRLPVGVDPQPYLREADAIMSGDVILFAAARFQVGAAPEWNRDPLTGVLGPSTFGPGIAITDRALVGDIKHVWELNRHLHLVRLAQACLLSGDAAYAAALARQIRGWLDQCPPQVGPNWTSSLELGIRLINWSLIWQLLGGAHGILFAGADGERLRQDWLASIFSHCQSIRRHLSRHSSANNHLIGELAGLYVAARTWPCWPQSAGWARQAKRELVEQAQLQHSGDGVNREQAFSYQVFTAEFLLVAGLAAARSADPYPAGYWTVLRDSLHFTRAVRNVAGLAPMYGDADDGIVFRLEPGPTGDRAGMLLALGDACFGALAPAARSASAQWLMADLAAPAPLLPAPSAGRDFSRGGYLLFGRAFGQPDEVKGMVDCGPLGYLGIAAHGHADALALTLSVCGQPCLVDPGTYSYWQDIRWRDYFRGTSAHNTLRVAGQDQSVSGGRFMWTRKAVTRLEQYADDGERFAFAGSHDGYTRLAGGGRHRRRVDFDAAQAVLDVHDEYDGGGAPLLEQFWHFAPELEVALDGQSVLVRGVGYTLRGQFSGPELTLALVQGQCEPPLGWFSAAYEVRVPSRTLRVATGRAGAVIHARFKIDISK